jgi:hypothetical protein
MIKVASIACVGLMIAASTAFGASGSLRDPKGDHPDVVKLRYDNARSKVKMTMTYAAFTAQNESFYMSWGRGTKSNYQVFLSPSANLKVLRYKGNDVRCRQLRVKRGTRSTTVTVPRSCLPKAPGRLRFQGIATEGLFSSDETAVSKAIRRG